MNRKFKCTLPDNARNCLFDEIKPDMRTKDLTERFKDFEGRRREFQEEHCRHCAWEETFGKNMKEQVRKKYVKEVVVSEKIRIYD